MPVDICVSCLLPILPGKQRLLGRHWHDIDCIARLRTKVAELERELAKLRSTHGE